MNYAFQRIRIEWLNLHLFQWTHSVLSVCVKSFHLLDIRVTGAQWCPPLLFELHWHTTGLQRSLQISHQTYLESSLPIPGAAVGKHFNLGYRNKTRVVNQRRGRKWGWGQHGERVTIAGRHGCHGNKISPNISYQHSSPGSSQYLIIKLMMWGVMEIFTISGCKW